MLRRYAAAALAALVLASPADAGRVLVVRQGGPVASQNIGGWNFQQATVENVLTAFGVNYDVVHPNQLAATTTGAAENLNQLSIRTGLVRFGGAVGAGSYTKQYDAIVHLGFAVQTAGNWPASYRPDSLTFAAKWPSIPQIFLGLTRTAGGSLYNNQAQCSTGVRAAGGITTAPAWTFGDISAQMVGQPWRWKVQSNTYYSDSSTHGLAIVRTTPGITKARVILGGSSLAFNTNGTFGSAPWPDSMSTPAAYTTTPLGDTAVVWTRERIFSNNSVDPAPLIFMLPANQGNGSAIASDHTLFAMCLAMADSVTGGILIGQTVGYEPPKIAFAMSGAFSHGQSGTAGPAEWDSHGVQQATINDTTHVKAGIDSLKALRIPVLVTVNIDSVAAYPNEKAWWSGITGAKFSPESRTGAAVSGVAVSGITNQYQTPDIFGRRRARSLITNGRYNNGTACSSPDTTMSCLLSYARARLDSIPEFSGRLSKTLIAPAGDYIPTNFTRAAMPNPDTLAVAMLRSGYNRAILDVLPLSSAPSASWANSAGGNAVPTAQAPYAPSPSAHTQVVPGFDSFEWLGSRLLDEAETSITATHEFSDELMLGVFGKPWYLGDTPYWNHNFRTKLSVFLFRPGNFGYRSTATSNVSRSGFHYAKWVVHKVRAINAFAGRNIIHIVDTDDL